MDKPLNSRLTRESGKQGGPGMVQPLKGLRPGLSQNSHAVHQAVVASEKGGQQHLVVDREVETLDLPNLAHRAETPCLRGIAAADRDDIAASGQTLDDVAADKTRPAEHCGSTISHNVPSCARL